MIRSQLEDTIEKLAEQGATQTKKAVKSAAQQIKQTISPTKLWEQLLGVDSNPSISPNPSISSNSPERPTTAQSHTSLNLEKLGKKYQDQESQKAEVLKHRLFQLVKKGEEEVLREEKKKEEEKKQKDLYEAQEKKRRVEEKKKQEQAQNLPKGKIRRSIFSPRKVAERQHAEFKPSSGKQ